MSVEVFAKSGVWAWGFTESEECERRRSVSTVRVLECREVFCECRRFHREQWRVVCERRVPVTESTGIDQSDCERLWLCVSRGSDSADVLSVLRAQSEWSEGVSTGYFCDSRKYWNLFLWALAEGLWVPRCVSGARVQVRRSDSFAESTGVVSARLFVSCERRPRVRRGRCRQRRRRRSRGPGLREQDSFPNFRALRLTSCDGVTTGGSLSKFEEVEAKQRDYSGAVVEDSAARAAARGTRHRDLQPKPLLESTATAASLSCSVFKTTWVIKVYYFSFRVCECHEF